MFTYNSTLDYNCVGQLKDSKGKVIHTYRANCYGSALSVPISDIKAKYFDFYWQDSLSDVLGNQDVSNKAFTLLKKAKVFSDAVSVRRIQSSRMYKFKQCSMGQKIEMPESDNYFRIRFDIDKCKTNHILLMGTIAREFSTQPRIIMDFINLYEIYKGKIDIFTLFLLAHTITFYDDLVSIYMHQGHTLAVRATKLTEKPFQKFIDLSSSLRTGKYFRGSMQEFFCDYSESTDKYGYGRKKWSNQFLTVHSEGSINSFLQKEIV